MSTKPSRSLFARLLSASTLTGLLALTPALGQDLPGLDLVDAALPAGAGACSAHAQLMRLACNNDRRDDYLVGLANCAYVVASEDQRDCRDEVRFERDERRNECEEVFDARMEICELVGEARFTPEIEADDFVDPEDIGDSVEPNPYWPLDAGHTHVILADGEVTVVTNTDEVRDVGGLPCRVVRDLVFEVEIEDGEVSYEPIEVTQDWYAQHIDGDVYYCGENTYEIEDGLIDNTDGSFAHDSDFALAGVLVRRFPVPGEGDRQEMASDEAEDYVEYLDLAATPSAAEGGDVAFAPCAGGCLRTFEANPHDPGESENKYYLPGTGFVLATKFEDGEPTGEREEVTCVGDSLEVLDDPACGIDDVEALREALCVWSPEDLCPDDGED
ncbi:MAG: hypothetical protein DWQ36_14880 [Acidobacteria bacterium]|nr:MAG: hypothetical protein DWQ30_10660 [Acidobacteriota bacterium]REK06176.1 MAG: hypothetical protein DWQ36_14880 [Acidobacteriota bacterium]